MESVFTAVAQTKALSLDHLNSSCMRMLFHLYAMRILTRQHWNHQPWTRKQNNASQQWSADKEGRITIACVVCSFSFLLRLEGADKHYVTWSKSMNGYHLSPCNTNAVIEIETEIESFDLLTQNDNPSREFCSKLLKRLLDIVNTIRRTFVIIYMPGELIATKVTRCLCW